MAKLIKVNTRGQVSLGGFAQYEHYMASVDENGVITLVPAAVVPLKRKADDQQR